MASTSEQYWNRRALAETKAALGCDNPHIAAIHVDLATRCVRQALAERERSEGEDMPAGPAAVQQAGQAR